MIPGPLVPGPMARGTVRLVATDMDGTFLDPAGRVTARGASAVQAARAAGIHVVPVTGRPPQALWDLAEAASLGPYGVCSNGAAIVDLTRREVIEVEEVPGPTALAMVEAVRAAVPGVLLATDDLERFSYEPGFFEVTADWQEALQEVPDICAAVADGCIKLIARRPGSPATALISVLTVAMEGHGHVTTSGLDWVDIGAPGVSKAYALARVCDRLGVTLDEVIAVGDHHNDLPVLSWAGTAMAPVNAIPEVLAVVHRVLPGNAEDGVAQLLEELASGSGDAARPGETAPTEP